MKRTSLSTLAALVMVAFSAVQGGEPPKPLSPAEAARTKVLAWLDQSKADAAARTQVAQLWSELPKEPAELDLLGRTADSFALVIPQAKELIQLCARPYERTRLAKQEWLMRPETPPLVAANLRLYYVRWLIHEALYDDAVEQLAGLAADQVVDPASLLFCQAVAYHQLLDRARGLQAVEELLRAGGQQYPQRYVALAKLMQEDLLGLKDETLDHIARRMGDIQRRLALGQGGPKVCKVEDGVVASLDKIIKKLEDQQGQGGGDGGMPNGIKSSSPAQDSRIAEGKGPGEVARRNIGAESGWGNISPKQREEAVQQIGRDYPAHYREIIEQYFRKRANEESK